MRDCGVEGVPFLLFEFFFVSCMYHVASAANCGYGSLNTLFEKLNDNKVIKEDHYLLYAFFGLMSGHLQVQGIL